MKKQMRPQEGDLIERIRTDPSGPVKLGLKPLGFELYVVTNSQQEVPEPRYKLVNVFNRVESIVDQATINSHYRYAPRSLTFCNPQIGEILVQLDTDDRMKILNKATRITEDLTEVQGFNCVRLQTGKQDSFFFADYKNFKFWKTIKRRELKQKSDVIVMSLFELINETTESSSYIAIDQTKSKITNYSDHVKFLKTITITLGDD